MQRQNKKSEEEQRLSSPAVGAGADQRGHRHHDYLGGDNTGGHQSRAEIPVLQCKPLPDQRQHRRVGEVKERDA